ncbi:MAG: MipA/OmpV family protein [Verrucomicrobiota bacterium]
MNSHKDTEFNITAAESEPTGFREYDPKGGVKNIEMQYQVEYEINKNWSRYGIAHIEYYLGESADSPLIKDIGSETTVELLVGVPFRW